MSKLSSNIILFFSSSAIAKALPFFSSLIITRIFSPDEFGLFQILIAYSSAFIPFVNLKASYLLAKQKNDNIILSMVAACILIMVLMSCIVSFVLLGIFFYNDLDFPFYLIFLILFLWASNDFLSNILVIFKKFKHSGYGQLIQSSFTESLKIFLGNLSNSFFSLIMAWVIGYTVTLFYFSKFIAFRTKDFINGGKELIKSFSENRSNIIYRIFSSGISNFNTKALIIISSLIVSSQEIGLLSLAYLFVVFPSGVIAQNISKVFFSDSRTLFINHDYQKLYKSTFKTGIFSFILGCFICLLFYFFFEQIFNYAYPSNWSGVNIYISILMFLIPFQFLSSSVVQLFSVLNLERWQFFFNLLVAIIYVMSLYFGNLYFFDYETSLVLIVLLHSMVRFFQFSILLFYTRRLL